MPVARQSTFTAGATLQAVQLNDEFDHLLGALTGSGNVDIKIIYNNSDVPTLAVDNTSSGYPFEARVSASAKMRINASGQIQSLLSTGTAPLVIASTTVNANLNADQVDGLDDTDLIRTAISPQTITKADTSIELTLTPTGNGADAGTASLYFDLRDAGTNVDAYWRVKGHGDDTFKIEQYDDGTTTWKTALEFDRNGASPYTKVYNPTNDALEQIATTEAKTTISIGAFYEGVASTGAKQIRWIAPADAEGIEFTNIRAVYGGGTPVGTTTIQFEQFDSTGTTVLTRTIDLLSTDVVDVVQVEDITDITTVSSGDYFEVTITAADLHEDISVWLQGTQSLIT
jgi:hypothetical protein